MAQMFFTLVTEIGAAKLANATALGTKVNLTHVAVGDGNGNPITPLPTMEALVHEVHRAPINNLSIDPGNASLILVEMVIPPEVGGFTVHEVGVFDDQGNLFAVASFPATYKPTLAEGSGRELAAILRIQVSSTASITLKIDPTMVLASRKYVDDKITVVRTLVEAHAARRDDPHETLPEGGEAGQVIIKQEDGSLAWGTVAGVPVGQLCFSTTASPLPGTVPVNVKQKFARDVYPQLVAFVQASGGFLATEAEWDAEAAAQEGTCGHYCLTDTHIILPCYKHYFASAQDGVAGKGVGDWLADEFKEHYHLYGDNPWQNVDFGSEPPNRTMGNHSSTVSAATPRTSVVGGDETRPKTSYLLPCIKAYDAAVNAAQVDMQALASLVAEINGNKVDWSEWAQKLHGPIGYQVFPGGLILQWGRTGIINSTAYATVTFPITFPNVAWIVVGCAIGDSAGDAAGNNGGCCSYIIDSSQFTIGHYNTGSNHNAMFWVAIGK